MIATVAVHALIWDAHSSRADRCEQVRNRFIYSRALENRSEVRFDAGPVAQLASGWICLVAGLPSSYISDTAIKSMRLRMKALRAARTLSILLSLLYGVCIAAPGEQHAEPATAFVHVAVVPMDREGVLDDWTVVVTGDRIRELGPATAVKVPEGAVVIDGRGKYLMPGLADMHTHTWAEDDFTLLRNFVDAGLPPYEAIRAGTSEAAEFLGASQEFGTVAEGRRADLILVEGNPLEDVANAGRRAGVMVRGKWYSTADLTAKLERLAKGYAAKR